MTECSSHSELLSGLPTKMKEITLFCSHPFILAMSFFMVMTSCCFDSSHLAVQVDRVRKADNNKALNFVLALG